MQTKNPWNLKCSQWERTESKYSSDKKKSKKEGKEKESLAHETVIYNKNLKNVESVNEDKELSKEYEGIKTGGAILFN